MCIKVGSVKHKRGLKPGRNGATAGQVAHLGRLWHNRGTRIETRNYDEVRSQEEVPCPD